MSTEERITARDSAAPSSTGDVVREGREMAGVCVCRSCTIIRRMAHAYMVTEASASANLARAELAERREKGLRKALREIEALKPSQYQYPPDWEEQIAACAECQRYKDHPIQQGICDTHRRPIWNRERHDSHEEKAIGYRAKLVARAALTEATPEDGE